MIMTNKMQINNKFSTSSSGSIISFKGPWSTSFAFACSFSSGYKRNQRKRYGL